MPSGSRVALGIVGIGLGGLTVVGSLAGTLAPALAGLFDPNILEPATSGSGGITIPPLARNPPTEGPGGEPNAEPSPNPIFPGIGGGSPGELGPTGGTPLPSGPSVPELPEAL